jgi:hypothetical protein
MTKSFKMASVQRKLISISIAQYTIVQQLDDKADGT